MTLPLSIHKQTCLVPVRFERACIGPPNAEYPEIDDRGFTLKIPEIDNIAEQSSSHAAAVSLCENSVVNIKLLRENIAPTAPLFITSSNSKLLKVLAPTAQMKCADGLSTTIKLHTLACIDAQAKDCTVEVRFGRYDGPIISELLVYVFPTLVVKVQPYLVAINEKNGHSGKALNLNLDAISNMTKAIWHPSGIELSFAKPISMSTNLQQANTLSCRQDVGELNSLTRLKWASQRINLYIVDKIDDAKFYSINAREYRHVGLERPAIFFASIYNSRNVAGDIHLCANELAHAMGCFFGLHAIHADSSSQDIWSMRSLMYSQNTIDRGTPRSPSWQSYNTCGYGNKAPDKAYRGALLALKSIPNEPSSAHCIEARKYISKGPKHVYS